MLLLCNVGDNITEVVSKVEGTYKRKVWVKGLDLHGSRIRLGNHRIKKWTQWFQTHFHRQPLNASSEVNPFSSVSCPALHSPSQGDLCWFKFRPRRLPMAPKNVAPPSVSAKSIQPWSSATYYPSEGAPAQLLHLGPRDPSLTPLRQMQAFDTGDRKLWSFSSDITSNTSAMKGSLCLVWSASRLTTLPI